jgi:hypothetical protein
LYLEKTEKIEACDRDSGMRSEVEGMRSEVEGMRSEVEGMLASSS